jgi:cystathionine beta-lyase
MAQRDDVGAFVLCNPHNPVGRAWREDELAAVAEICAAHDVLVVSDEIHAPVVYPWARFVSFGVVAPPGLRHAVLTGPSKAFNLPALKTSLTIVPHPGLREAFAAERHRLNEDFGVGVLGVAALEAAYRDGGPWLDAFIEHLAGNVGVLESGLGTGPVRVVRPDASFLVWLDFRALGLDDEALAAALRATELELEPGTAFGGAGSGFMRINVATTRERVADAVGRISRIAR